jgi:predicted nucleic acid-binding protein
MALVIDVSVALPWFLEDERSRFSEALLESIDRIEFWAPVVWCLELPNALLAAERKRRIDRARRLEAIDQASRLGIRIDAALPDMKAIGALAERHGLSAYDASYLELALRQGFDLATLDRSLAAAAAAEGVVVHAPGRSGAAQPRGRLQYLVGQR